MIINASILGAVVAAGLTFSVSAMAAEPAQTTVTLILKDHRFTPSTLTVPAGQPVRIELRNQDGTAEEFDSEDLHAEKDVGPHAKVVIQIGPLKPGTYHFMGELNSKTAQGQVIVEAP